MISEEGLTKILFFQKDFHITLTSGFRLSLKSVFVRVVLFFNVIVVVRYVLATEIHTVQDFVVVISSIIFGLMIFTKLYISHTKNEIVMETYESLQIKTSTDKTDQILLALLALGIWAVSPQLQFIFASPGLYQFVIRTLSSIGLLNCILYIVQLATLKHLIVKELKAVSCKFDNNFDQLVTATRKILDFNLALNKSYSLFLMTYVLWVLIYLMSLAYILWEIKEAELENSFAFQIFTNSSFFALAIGLAELSSRVSDEVQRIKTNIDALWIIKGHIETNRKILSAFLLELYHTPVQPSAFGLFKVNRASVIVAAGTFITYMMVLIQFY